MFTLMKKYPSYVQSLIEELQSCELANEILARYEGYSEDPMVKPLYSLFLESRTTFIYSSQVLALLESSAKFSPPPFRSLSVNPNLEPCAEDNPLSPVFQDLSRSTLWSEGGTGSKDQKTLKQLSFEVKSIVYLMKNCTYKEVADSIVGKQILDNEKNVRRRVYDAINVLTSVGIFEKRGKQIYYIQKNEEVHKNVLSKKEALKKVVKKYDSLNAIICRNKEKANYRQAVQMPFFLVVGKKGVIFIQAIMKTQQQGNEFKVLSNKKLKVVKSVSILHLFKLPVSQSLPSEVYQLIVS
jgi:hypothetical protein